MRQLVGLRTNQIVGPVNIAAAAARPATANDGVDISTWRSSGVFLDPLAQVFLDSTAAGSLTSPSGSEGVELWGYQPAVGGWYLIALLNKGNAIAIAGAGQGYSEVISDLGDYTRLAVAATISAGAPFYHFAPMESWTY